jgi:hypothetical protein|tara:strand:- start:38 stop:196 length:159 start_codon:yes stop_codon:yes gene_type:complete
MKKRTKLEHIEELVDTFDTLYDQKPYSIGNLSMFFYRIKNIVKESKDDEYRK